MIEYECSRERFLSDVKDHKMEVIKDDGLHRHLRFSRNGSSCYRFDLVTWPGYLCISGDMGCCVFSRIEDMFDFFIMSDNDWNKKNIINPYYWEEKIQSVSSFKGVKEFDPELFKQRVTDLVKAHYWENEDLLKECMTQLKEEVFDWLEDEPKECIYRRLYDFKYEDFFFDADELPDGEVYTFRYIWLCYAIVWGIAKYKNMSIEW